MTGVQTCALPILFILNENVTNFNRKWSTHDIMVTAILSIVLGLLNIPLTYLGSYLIAFPIVFPIMMGIGFFPLILVAYLIRKPGSVLLSSFIIMAVGVPFTPYGVVMLGQVLMYGLPLEIVFLLGRYRHFESWFMAIAGIVVNVIGGILFFISYGILNMDILIQLIIVVETIISGVLFAGLLSKWLGDAVLKTGVIR